MPQLLNAGIGAVGSGKAKPHDHHQPKHRGDSGMRCSTRLTHGLDGEPIDTHQRDTQPNHALGQTVAPKLGCGVQARRREHDEVESTSELRALGKHHGGIDQSKAHQQRPLPQSGHSAPAQFPQRARQQGISYGQRQDQNTAAQAGPHRIAAAPSRIPHQGNRAGNLRPCCAACKHLPFILTPDQPEGQGCYQRDGRTQCKDVDHSFMTSSEEINSILFV